MPRNRSSYELFDYLLTSLNDNTRTERLPSLKELSTNLNISVACLREQLEVAKAFGFVEVRPRTGIRRLPYSFLPVVKGSLFYAIESDPRYFDDFSTLRNHVEAAYWHEAAQMLTSQDHLLLMKLVSNAWAKLDSRQVQIPHEEHRALHMGIFQKLNNPFVIGILEAYWEAYEAVGLNLYTDYDYLRMVWQYHQRMIEAICAGDLEGGYRILVEHSDLLYQREDT